MDKKEKGTKKKKIEKKRATTCTIALGISFKTKKENLLYLLR